MGQAPPLSQDDVLRILGELDTHASEADLVLIGGQAVAIWAYRYPVALAALSEGAAMGSVDMDFRGTADHARAAGLALNGTVEVPDPFDPTPNAGLVRFVDSQGVEREIDFLKEVYGVDGPDVLKEAVKFEMSHPDEDRTVSVWVMGPFDCMRSKAANLLGLRQGAAALNQLRASVACVPEHSRFILDGAKHLDMKNRVRRVLNINAAVFRFATRSRHGLHVYRKYGLDPFDACLTEHNELPEEFGAECLPRWREVLRRRRGPAS